MDIKEHLQKFMAQQNGLRVTPLLEQGLVAAIGQGGGWALTEAGHVLLNGEDLPTRNPGDWVKVDGDHTQAAEEDWTNSFLSKHVKPGALSEQIGGDHYKDFPIQPVEFIEKNGIRFLEGCIIKRICRHEAKAGVEDLRKAIHEIRLLMELRYGVSE